MALKPLFACKKHAELGAALWKEPVEPFEICAKTTAEGDVGVEKYASTVLFQATVRPMEIGTSGDGEEPLKVAMHDGISPSIPVSSSSVSLEDVRVIEEVKKDDRKNGKQTKREESKGSDSESGVAGVYVVEKILKKRTHYRTGAVQYLIKWKGYDREEDNTWEPAENCVSAAEAIKEFEERVLRKKRAASERTNKKKRRPLQRCIEGTASGKKTRTSVMDEDSNDESDSEKDSDDALSANASGRKRTGDADTGCSVGEKKKVNRIIGLKRHRDGELLALVCDKNGTYKLERTRVLQKTCPQELFDYYESLVVFAGNRIETMDDK
uniref:Chromo domain-containing protein n=1 Tax=Ascaris lumbricoides TaxID=6252 RepID=A0A0M3IHG7_ASCLU